MDCPECFQNFDEKLRRPKALPCGHTFCLDCLQKEDKCFEDRKTFEKIPIDLPDCHNLLSIMRSIITTNSSENTLNVWCNDCEDQATDNCVDGGHQVTSTKTKKFQDALKKLSKSGNELDFSFLHKTYDSLDEDAKSEVKEVMQGRLIPTDILLIGGNKRWSSSIKLPSTHEDENVDLCLYLLSLLRAKGIIPKDCLLPAKNPDTSIDDVDQEDGSELDLTNISSCKNQESMEEEKKVQLFSDKLLNVKRVKGLDCDNDSDWCLQILQRLAPSLEEAHLFNFHVQHLETIYSMPQLRWLVLENLIGKKNNTGYELPTSVHPGKVEFLWMNIHDDKLSKSIVTSLQQSLRTVFIHVPFYHADAIEFFDGLDLPSLQLLMYGSRYCDSDNCSTIMTGLRKKFPGKKIFCFCCGRTELFDD